MSPRGEGGGGQTVALTAGWGDSVTDTREEWDGYWSGEDNDTDPGYKSNRKEKFRTDRFEKRNKPKFPIMQTDEFQPFT